MKVVALDPGETTGYAVYSRYTSQGGYERSLTSSQMGSHPHHLALYEFLELAQPQVVVCEDFKYQRGPGGHNLTPVEYIGVVKLWTAERHVPLVLQPRSRKTLWDDGKIKELGLWKPGKPHAMDAVRHLLYYLTVDHHEYYYVKQLEP